MKKNEIRFVVGILLFAGILWLILTFLPEGQCNSIHITIDGKEYGTWSLSEDQIIKIGDSNVCEIKNGQARMTHTTCPDHLCEKQLAIGSHGGIIVCLPNRVIIEGLRPQNDNSGVDAVAS